MIKGEIIMNQETTSLPEVLKKLNNALKTLETTIINHNILMDKHNEWEEEIQYMNADRNRLAQELDNSEARAERLKEANKEVSKRLITAMEAIRTLLDR